MKLSINFLMSLLVYCFALTIPLHAGKEKELLAKKYYFQFFGQSSHTKNESSSLQLAIQKKNLDFFNVIHVEKYNNYLLENYSTRRRFIGPRIPLNLEEPLTPEDKLGVELNSIVNEFCPNGEEFALFYEHMNSWYSKEGYYTDSRTGEKIDFDDNFYNRLDKLSNSYREQMNEEFEIKEKIELKKTKDVLSKIMSKKAQKKLKKFCEDSQKE